MKQAIRIVIGFGAICALLACIAVGLMVHRSMTGRSTASLPRDIFSIVNWNDSREIVCWGDSLTEGIGASEAIVQLENGTFDAS